MPRTHGDLWAYPSIQTPADWLGFVLPERPMPYTANLRLSVQSAGSNSGVWGAGGAAGDDLNTGVMGVVDTRFAEPAAFSVSSSNVSLSYANVQCNFFRFTGTLLANIVVSPAVGDATTYFNGFYLFENVTAGSFTITLQNASGSVVLPQGRRGIVYVSAANSLAPRIVSLVGSGSADPIAAGSKTLFYNTAAPSGWTAVALNDYAIKIVTAGSGGVTSGSVAYSTLFGRTATDAHTLTTNEIPLHGHAWEYTVTAGGGSASGGFRLGDQNFLSASAYTGAPSNTVGQQIGGTGGGASHSHSIDMRVLTAAFSLASRD